MPIICGKCGASTNRRYDARWVNNTVHICSNPECKATYAIGDEALWDLVRIKIVAADETEVEPSEEIMTAVRRLTNEIDHDLQGLDVDAETLKNKIFECAALQYAALHIKRERGFHRDETALSRFNSGNQKTSIRRHARRNGRNQITNDRRSGNRKGERSCHRL